LERRCGVLIKVLFLHLPCETEEGEEEEMGKEQEEEEEEETIRAASISAKLVTCHLLSTSLVLPIYQPAY
jgi:hypothetical protein